jgi:hypothetical protein
MLKVIEGDKLNSRVVYASNLSEFKNLPKSQNEQLKSSQQNNISQSAKFSINKLHKALEETNEQENSNG